MNSPPHRFRSTLPISAEIIHRRGRCSAPAQVGALDICSSPMKRQSDAAGGRSGAAPKVPALQDSGVSYRQLTNFFYDLYKFLMVKPSRVTKFLPEPRIEPRLEPTN